MWNSSSISTHFVHTIHQFTASFLQATYIGCMHSATYPGAFARMTRGSCMCWRGRTDTKTSQRRKPTLENNILPLLLLQFQPPSYSQSPFGILKTHAEYFPVHYLKWPQHKLFHWSISSAELRSCVEVEVAVPNKPMVYVDVKQLNQSIIFPITPC